MGVDHGLNLPVRAGLEALLGRGMACWRIPPGFTQVRALSSLLASEFRWFCMSVSRNIDPTGLGDT